jgi:hypothetical protein
MPGRERALPYALKQYEAQDHAERPYEGEGKVSSLLPA